MTDSTIRLSICIPTYNRAAYLPDLLASILTQYDERVEIVICDNGSSDGTSEIAEETVKRYPRVVYDRILSNIGPDRCFLRSVERASGEFCWLMGDDDKIEEGALEKILSVLDSSLSGITVNRFAYDCRLQNRYTEPDLGPGRTTLFTDANPCCRALFLFFGFLSAQIIHRSRWLEVVKQEDLTPYYNAYVLVYIIGRMIRNHPRWLYIQDRFVGWRGDNDSFAKELGMIGRFTLDVSGYKTIVSGLFFDDPKTKDILLNKVCRVHFFGHLRKIRFSSLSGQEIKTVLSFCYKELGKIPSFRYKILPLFFLPYPVLLVIRSIYKTIKCLRAKSVFFRRRARLL